MKKLITLTLTFASIFSLNAQQEAPPQGINYQAVAVDNSNKEIVGTDVAAKPVADKEIRVRFSILKTSETGALTYREEHLVTTDAYGLFNTVIGQGIQDASTMAFNQIDWGTGYHFLKVEIDITGGTDYKDMGTQQLWSVPYALYSKYADAAGNGIDSVADNGDGTITFTYLDGSTYTTSPLTGLQGPAGPAGANGQDGLSAYEIWISQGNTGSEADFLAGLTGPQGIQGPQGPAGIAGTNGQDGLSAYEIWISQGNTGTEADFLAGLTGPQGVQGPQGPAGIAGTNGQDGLSAYEIWLSQGNTGTESDFLNSIQGAQGPIGPQGIPGDQNAWGLTGNSGTSDATSFIGTTDNVALNFRVNNVFSGKIDHLNNNVFFGYNSGNNSMTGSFNVAYGNYSLPNNTTGYDNTAIGRAALLSNTTGYHNTAVGRSALNNNSTGIGNTAVGTFSLQTNSTSSGNTGIGYGALRYNETGNDNVSVGYNALAFNIDGYQNIAIGRNSLYSNTSGFNNTSVGYRSMFFNTTGFRNVSYGEASLYRNISGQDNTAVGLSSLLYNTIGNYNTAIGNFSMVNNSDGNYNTSVGYASFNTGTTQFNNSTAIGYNTIITASDQVRIGNSSITSIGGQVGWSTLSDSRLKSVSGNFDLGLEFILKLNPVTYTYNNSENKLPYNGLLAQDVESLLTEMNAHFSGLNKPQNDGDFYSIRYSDFVLPLINSVQELNEINKLLEEKIKVLEDRINGLETKP